MMIAKDILMSSCSIEFPMPQKCDPSSEGEYCHLAVFNVTVAEDFSSGFYCQTQIFVYIKLYFFQNHPQSLGLRDHSNNKY